MEKYIKDGKVAILVSPGFGAGWSTWNDKNLACDKRVVEFWLSHKDDGEYLKKLDELDSPEVKKAKALFQSWGYNETYFGGFMDIELHWLPEGTKYYISEYDGHESLKTIEYINWQMA